MRSAEDRRGAITAKLRPSEHRVGRVVDFGSKEGAASITATSDGTSLVLHLHRTMGSVEVKMPDGSTCSLETGRRVGRVPLQNPEQVWRAFAELGTLDHEEGWIVALDNNSRLKGKHLVSRGGVATTALEVKQALRAMIHEGATAMIFVHNHPSGDPKPSKEDGAMTVKLQTAGAVAGIPLIDHVIIARDGYFSFMTHGLLGGPPPLL